MDPGRGGSSSRTEFGREGSSSPTGTPGLEPATERTPRRRAARSTSWRRPREFSRATHRGDRAPPTPSSMTAARCSPSSSRAGSTSTNSSPRGRHPRIRGEAGSNPRARPRNPARSVSNGRERHRPSLRPPSRLVFSRRGSWRRTARHSRASPRRPTTAKKTANAETAAIAARRILADDDRFRLVDDSDSVLCARRGTQNGLGLDSPATEPESIATAVPETDQDRFEPDRSPLDADRSNVISTSTPSTDVDDDFERFYARYAFESNMAARSGRAAAVVLAMDAPQTPAESELSPPVSLVSRATSRSPPGTETRAAAAARRAAAEAALRATAREDGGGGRGRRREGGGGDARGGGGGGGAAKSTHARGTVRKQKRRARGRGVVPRRSRPPAVSRVANDGNRSGLAGKRTFRPGRRGARARDRTPRRRRESRRCARVKRGARREGSGGARGTAQNMAVSASRDAVAIETVEVKHELSSGVAHRLARSARISSSLEFPRETSLAFSPRRRTRRGVTPPRAGPMATASVAFAFTASPSVPGARARSARRVACASRAVR